MGFVIALLVVAALLGFGALYDYRRRMQLRNEFANDQERRDYQIEKPVAGRPMDPGGDAGASGGSSGF